MFSRVSNATRFVFGFSLTCSIFALPALAQQNSINTVAGGMLVQDGTDKATVVTVESNGPPQLVVSASPYVVKSPLVVEEMDIVHKVRAQNRRDRDADIYRRRPSRSEATDFIRPRDDYYPPQQVQNEPADSNQETRVDLAEKRMMQNVPDDIESYFDLFMYVSKANTGPMGQRMFVFERDNNGQVIPYAEWRVSTGREQWEVRNGNRTFTATPEGVFRLDPDRFHVEYYSRTYDNAPMPYAMFLDMRTRGYPTGLAIHAAASASKIARLGRRDSGGCVRLSPKNAKELFYKIKNTTDGMVPVFAESGGSTDRWGRASRDGGGNIRLTEGYKALLMIEDFDGRGMVGPVVAYTH